MAYTEFKETFWSDKVFSQYRNNMVMLPLANREYEGTITGAGQRIKINEIGTVTTNSYVQGTDIAYEELSDASKFLDIDQQDYTAITLDDIDNAQTKPKLMTNLTAEMGISMANNVDAFLMALGYADANISSGTTGSPTSVTSAGVISLLNSIAVDMDDANVPKIGRVAILPNWLAGKITLAQIIRNTDNSKILQSGYMGEFCGFSVYQSNNVTHSGTTWYAPLFFRASDTIAFASQIVKSEALRDKDQFADLVRMLNVYGAKTVRPSSLFTAIVAEGAESAI